MRRQGTVEERGAFRENGKVTVVMPTFNRARYLDNAIRSVLGQTMQHWLLLIADDGSTDGTEREVRRYLSDPRIEYVRFADNRGTGAVLADALALVRTAYFVVLDSDDWLDARALGLLLEEMEAQDENTALAYGNTVYWSEQGDRIQVASVERQREFKDKYDFMLYLPMVKPRFYRTSAVREVGGFELDDPHRGRYMEDRYLLLKLIHRFRFHFVNEKLYNHRLHDANISGKANKELFQETRLYVYPKLLKQWGDEYEPVFEHTPAGWLHLHKLIPKTSGLPMLAASKYPLPLPALHPPEVKVTVVMPTYDRAPFIREAIQSVLDQTLQQWRLLIIDDASTDETEAIVGAFGNDRRIHYVRRPVNGGIGPVLNDALKLVDTPYFMQLDADDWIEQETLSVLLGEMERSGNDTALAYGDQVVHRSNRNGETQTLLKHRDFKDKYDVLLYRWMVAPRFYRTQAVRAVGGWDLNVPYNGRYMEDRQMFYKLAGQYRLRYVERTLYHYRLHGSNLSLSGTEKYAEIRIFLVQRFFEQWRGETETNAVMEWEYNDAGWPQFRLVPPDLRVRYAYVIAAATRDELTEERLAKAAKRIKSLRKRGATIVAIALDGVHRVGRYARGFDVDAGPGKERFYPLPDKAYAMDDELYDRAKAMRDTVGWKAKRL